MSETSPATPRLPIRILIVDDHVVVRRGLRMVLSLHPDFEIVGEAGSGRKAIQVAGDTQPDLILLDLVLPDVVGAELPGALRQSSPSSKILILSGVQSAPNIQAVVQAGIDGYVPKEVAPGELTEAIRQVMAGNEYLHPDISRLLQSQETGGSPTGGDRSHFYVPSLTRREREVLALMATTATNREIAERLVLSEETIRSHVKSILRKLRSNNRTQAVLEAVRRELIQL